MNSTTRLLEAIARRESVQAELDGAALEVSRAMLELRDVEGMPPKQIAELLGLSHQRIYQVLARAERDVEAQYESYRLELEERAERARLERLDVRRGGKRSGLGAGRVQPRCASCDQFIATISSRCGSCGNWGGEY